MLSPVCGRGNILSSLLPSVEKDQHPCFQTMKTVRHELCLEPPTCCCTSGKGEIDVGLMQVQQ